MCAFVYAYECACACMCMCVHVCVCMCIYMCVSIYLVFPILQRRQINVCILHFRKWIDIWTEFFPNLLDNSSEKNYKLKQMFRLGVFPTTSESPCHPPRRSYLVVMAISSNQDVTLCCYAEHLVKQLKAQNLST